MSLVHEPDCTGERVERFTTPEPSGLHAVVLRCLDCGAQDTWAHGPHVPPLPTTPHDPNATTTGPWRFQ